MLNDKAFLKARYHVSSVASKESYRGYSPALFKGEKIERFVTLTPNPIHKSLKTHHFLNEISKFETQLPKNAFF